MAVYPRISARRNNVVELDVTFFRGGVPTDPYAIRSVSIYKTQVLPHNLVAQFILLSPCDGSYPSPVEKATGDIPAGDCGTEAQEGALIPGKFVLNWEVPSDAQAPDVYFDVWSYYPTNPCLLAEFEGDTDCVLEDGVYCHQNLDSEDLAGLLLQNCGKFWVYPDNWVVSDNLSSIRIGFEPMDQKFRQPEVRPLEVGIMPLPLYDYDFNLNVPVIPFFTATITIETMSKEVLVDAVQMEMGIRQGSYRSNPFVFRYMVNTSSFLIGTYKYRVTITLPDGTTRASKDFIMTVS